MIDCPGIVPPNQQDSDEELLLRGSIRVENVEWPAQYVEAVLRRVEPKHLQRTYEVSGYKDSTGFLEQLCVRKGRLLKGGEPDLDSVARIVLNDWIRGKVPWFTPLPAKEGGTDGPVQRLGGREGKLGEMPRKRKRGSEVAESVAATNDTSNADMEDEDDDDDDDDEFSGFGEGGGLELDADDSEDDEEENAEDVEVDVDAKTLVASDDASEDDKDVDEEVAAISAALTKAKKRRRKE